MLKAILAYIIAWFLAPIIGVLVGFVYVSLLTVAARVYSVHRDTSTGWWRLFVIIFGFVANTCGGFAATYAASLVFALFGKEPTIWMLIMLGVGFTMTALPRILSTRWFHLRFSKLLWYAGQILGVIIGGVCSGVV